jgi:fucose permease
VLGYYIVNTYKSFGQTIPVLDDDQFLSTISSISALFNAARFIWSGALDKFAFKKVYGVLLLIQITLAFTIGLTQKSKVSFSIFICLALFCIGGHFALFPNVLKQVFGKQATGLYGVMFTGTGLGSLFIVGLIFSPIGKSYHILFYIFGTLSVISLVILTFFFKQRRFEPDWPSILHDAADVTSEEIVV